MCRWHECVRIILKRGIDCRRSFLLGSQLVLARNLSGRAGRQGSETKLASLDAKWLSTCGDVRLATGRR